MKRPKISYANVVATLALFIALGGVSWAAVKLPKNSVGSKQIKKNAVTNAKIKNNAVNSRKIKNGSIVGSDINLGSLGTVPSATRADAAATAEDNIFVLKTGAVTASDNAYGTAQANATQVPLYETGQLKFYGKCFKDADDDQVNALIYASTTTSGTFFNAYNIGAQQGGAIGPGTSEDDRYIVYDFAGNNTVEGDYDYDASVVIGTDGVGIQTSATVAIRNGNPGGEVATIYPAEESCVFTLKGRKIKL